MEQELLELEVQAEQVIKKIAVADLQLRKFSTNFVKGTEMLIRHIRQ